MRNVIKFGINFPSNNQENLPLTKPYFQAFILSILFTIEYLGRGLGMPWIQSFTLLITWILRQLKLVFLCLRG